ncbi:golgin subfamily A member 6-like protein 6 isoform X2 [Dreissena polymorpha]|uniref:golgin subfamily A member 6-like protein 6 isoform X2 n=1 Tax=Dreissena polymorpha TaxID=45954 RepID=UPI0022644BE7|nr:golgin subfamily A member 6-like protein 6 isoform X2 [Dreissena polymorpha]
MPDFKSGGRPLAPLGGNTYRKARGGMSLASGYLTPTSRKTVLEKSDTLDNITPPDSPSPQKSYVSLKTEYASNKKATMQTPSVYESPSTHASQSPSKKVFHRSHRGRGGKGRGRFNHLGRTSQESHNVDNIAKRVLSARRLKINEIQNQNQELQLQIKDLKEENKLLKKTQNRADKALQKFEDRESELPQLIQRQNNEVRSLRDQIRKWREKYEKTDRYLRDAEDELEKLKIKLKKLKSLADEKELPERSDLNKKLNNAELDMEAKDVKIKELERYIQNLEKNHRHELGIERARQKDVTKQLTELREQHDKLNITVQEKEKEIQMKNIYVQRAQQKPPHRLPNSYNGTPQGTPPPRRRRQSLSEADKMTPRDRAKMMEEKRRDELKKQRELKMQHDKIKREKELRRMQEDDEKKEEERREREEKEQREMEERERRMNEEAQRDAEERRSREERERMKREAQEREQREKERREREEREEREREKKLKREQEERERRERERLEQERRAAEERRKFEDDVTVQAERKKKDEILAKLREIDEGGAGRKKDKESANDPFFVTQVKEDSTDSMASKKSYTFTKPIENLHKGKPARKDPPSSNTSFTVGPGRKTRNDVGSIETGGYNPTFGSKHGGGGPTSTAATKTFSLFDDEDSKSRSTVPPKPANKSKLMEDLFGSSDNNAPKHNDLFSSSKPVPKRTRETRGGFPWDEDGPSTKNQSEGFKAKRENSATLFGGGSALVNDEDFQKSSIRNNATLPRRPKQATATLSSKPTVNAVDHFDDEIEEVIL